MIPLLAVAIAIAPCDSTGGEYLQALTARLRTELSTSPDDLARIEAHDVRTGARFVVYHDPASASLARRVLPVLSSFYHQIACVAALRVSDVNWGAVAFVTDSSYRAPAASREVRWTVVTDGKGDFTTKGAVFFYVVLPHEQVHATQSRALRLPRWFSEGQAEWVGLRVTSTWRGDLATDRRRTHAASLAELGDAPADLHLWEGPRIRPEALRGQPPPYRFGPGDIISDESKTLARYAAAWKLFESVHAASGENGTREWFRAVAESTSPVSEAQIVELARKHAGIDIAGRLTR